MSQSPNMDGGRQAPTPLNSLNLAQHGASHTGAMQASAMSTWLAETPKQGPWTAVGWEMKRDAPKEWHTQVRSLELDMERARVHRPDQTRT